MELNDRVVDDGIVRWKFTLSGQSVLDLALDFLNQLSCLALHCIVSDRSLETPDVLVIFAAGLTHPSASDKSLEGSAPETRFDGG